MARNGKISERVAQVLRDNAGKPVQLNKLVREASANPQAISSAITYLRKKHDAGNPTGLPVTTLTRGKVWAYYPPENTGEPEQAEASGGFTVNRTALRAMAKKLTDAGTQEQLRNTRITPPDFGAELDELEKAERTLRINTQFAELSDLVPKAEPTVTLRVLGTLRETGEVLVQSGDGDHFDRGVWAMRRLA